MWANPYLSPIFVLFPYNGHSQQYTNIYEVFPLTSYCIYLQLYIFRFIYNYSIYIRIRSIDVISHGSIHYYRIQKRSYQLPGVYMSWYILASHLYIVGVTRITSPFIYSLSYIYNSNQLWIVVTIHTHTYVYIYTIPTIYIDRYLLWHRLVIYMVYIGTVYLMSMLTHTHACTVHMLYS